ncbi:MAG TPA: hypothetical protein VH021_25265 [Trebonia sp.]|nr:hypothetical protein [Trebonia sp.]
MTAPAPSADGGGDAASRAARLLRWYPRTWRDRYGEEFAELLISDIEERPQAPGRSLDVMRGGLVARLSAVGLCGLPLRDPGAMAPGTAGDVAAGRHVTASLVALGCCLAVALGFGAAMWSQLTIGWQWSRPASTPSAAGFATVATSGAMSALLVIAVLAALPVLGTVGRRIAARQAGGLLRPSAVLVAAGWIIVAGGRHFENGWPGTGGHGGLIPGGVAAFEWATSLSVSSYWAHPGALGAFPAAEVAWMAVCPLAQAAAVISGATVVRRAGLSARVLAFETRLAAVACTVMIVLLAGCSCWVATGGQPTGGQPGGGQPGGGQPSLFHAGLIDVAGIAVLSLALAIAVQAARTARRGLGLARG